MGQTVERYVSNVKEETNIVIVRLDIAIMVVKLDGLGNLIKKKLNHE